MSYRIRKTLLYLFTCCALLSFPASSALADLAPLNPDFVKYQEEQEFKPSGTDSTLRGRTPAPLDLSHLRGITLSEEITDYPASYDLRELGYVSPIRNQSPYGSCWTFGALASLESTTRKLMGQELDLSERYMMYFAYVDELDLPGFGDYTAEDFPDTANCGGDDYKATALLSRWTGAVLEEDAPYDDWEYIPTGFEEDAIHLQQVLYLYVDLDTRYPEVNIENIKHALTNYGAVAVGVWADDAMAGYCESSDYYNPATFAYYVPEINSDDLSVGCANHEVSIVGWDDSFASTDFASQPPGDGAWIVRNSWGTDWGDEGYYYLSYYDAVLDTGAAYIGEPADNYRNIYQYDPLGWVNSSSVPDQQGNTAWFANVFTSTQTEVIKAVSFYAGGTDNSYEINIYDQIGGELVYGPQEGTLPEPGYQTITLDNPVLFAEGEDLAVTVKLTTPGYAYPIAVEVAYPYYSDKASALPGQSYTSSNGIAWTDTTDYDPSMNVCLKAFTGPVDLDISGLENAEYTDLTDTSGADAAVDEACKTLEQLNPESFGMSGDFLQFKSLMDYRVISGDLSSGRNSISMDSSLSELSEGNDLLLLLAWNYEEGRYDVLAADGTGDLASSGETGSIQIADGGSYESPSEEDGVLSNLKLMEVLVSSETTSSSGGGGGGCMASPIAPMFALSLMPLLLLMKKGQ